MSSLTELAEQLLEHARRLDGYTTANKLPSASFDTNVYGDLPAELQPSRCAAADIAQTIRRLAMGPEAIGLELCHSIGAVADHLIQSADSFALRMIYLYNVPQAIPIDGSATYEEISKACNLSQSLVYRCLRHLMANRVFSESAPGHVSHTATSRMMVAEPDFFDNIGMCTCEVAPAFNELPEALVKFSDSGEQNEAGFSLSNDTKLSLWQFLADKPERTRRFAQSMKFMTKSSSFSIKHLTTTYDWAALDLPGTTLVDVGGGHGAVVQHLADSTENVKFIVQDLPGTVEQGRELLPAKYKSRIEFRVHDYYRDQKIIGKDIYFFRWIFHNQSDKYCIKILKALVPAMKNGTKVLVYEMILPISPQTSLPQKLLLDADLIMAALFNGRERNENDWRDMFRKADSRFSFKGVTDTPGSSFSVIEVVWED
ncbi:hypothetical protein ACLMJK_003161 [Lecanora helva]